MLRVHGRCYAEKISTMMPKPGEYRPIENDPALSLLGVETEQIKMLSKENEALRKAGARLARRAMYVVAEYDGLHRLALAVAEWAKVMGDENGRGESA